MLTTVALVALLGAKPAPTKPPGRYRVVLYDGTVYDAAAAPDLTRAMIPIHLPGGQDVVVYASDVNREATRLANLPPPPKPTPAMSRLVAASAQGSKVKAKKIATPKKAAKTPTPP